MEAEEAAMEEVEEDDVKEPPVRKISEKGTGPDRLQGLLALSGIVGPVLLWIVVIILGFLQPGYSHVTQFISELGAVGAPNALVQDANFIIFGILTVSFAFGLHRGISGGKGSKVGPALVAVFGAGWVGVGIFPCDPGCVNESFAGIMHTVIVFIALSFAIMPALLFIARRLKGEASWQKYRSFSLFMGIAAIVAFVVGFFFEINPAAPNPFLGGFQRLYLGIISLWIIVMAVRLLRLSLRPGAEGAPAG